MTEHFPTWQKHFVLNRYDLEPPTTTSKKANNENSSIVLYYRSLCNKIQLGYLTYWSNLHNFLSELFECLSADNLEKKVFLKPISHITLSSKQNFRDFEPLWELLNIDVSYDMIFMLPGKKSYLYLCGLVY